MYFGRMAIAKEVGALEVRNHTAGGEVASAKVEGLAGRSAVQMLGFGVEAPAEVVVGADRGGLDVVNFVERQRQEVEGCAY